MHVCIPGSSLIHPQAFCFRMSRIMDFFSCKGAFFVPLLFSKDLMSNLNQKDANLFSQSEMTKKKVLYPGTFTRVMTVSYWKI